ncbi:MAG: transaldolase [Monoraphidium minutum]|nr:MAG: transaldolase [Monoraphidium minutum]
MHSYIGRTHTARGAAPAHRAAPRCAPPPRAWREADKRAAGEAAPGGAPAAGFANQLDALRSMSVVVADTGEPELVKLYKPVDCTTNPSLVYKAVQNADYARFLSDALAARGAAAPGAARPYAGVADVLSVNIGCEMLKIVPGRVSTEVDAHLSHDAAATYDKALRLMELYAAKGVDPSRVYIKMASTWAGVEACRRLQREGIDCNMTLLFSFAQAAACADAGAALISPFVGRIMDWYKAKEGREFAPAEDPGVLSVKRIYGYYKTHGYRTIVMAASFRNAGEIRELAGCDNITIAPPLLAELEASTAPLERRLSPGGAPSSVGKHEGMSQAAFDEMHGADAMAVDKLAEGIKGFAADQDKLEAQLAALAATV